MGRRRGFIAEWQHQKRLAEQQERRRQTAADRAHRVKIREFERACKEAARADAEMQRALTAQRAEAIRKAESLRKASLTAEADAENAGLAARYAAIDSLLEATLDVDDFVDLEALKTVAEHPPFDAGAMGEPVAAPNYQQYPPEPVLETVPAPKLFGGKSKYERAIAEAHQRWVRDHMQWQHRVYVVIPAHNDRLYTEHQQAETNRLQQLKALRETYDNECAEREQIVADQNAELDELIRDLDRADPSAIDDYVGIVLANSVYPEDWPVTHTYDFDADLGELALNVTVPAPEDIPTVKHVKYIASADEIRSTELAKTDQRRRYSTAVAATALRTLHEIFEADRRARIASISLTVATNAIDPATGHSADVPLVLAAAEREQFLALNLAGVEPTAALIGIRAAGSKNPYGLVPVETGAKRVRR